MCVVQDIVGIINGTMLIKIDLNRLFPLSKTTQWLYDVDNARLVSRWPWPVSIFVKRLCPLLKLSVLRYSGT